MFALAFAFAFAAGLVAFAALAMVLAAVLAAVAAWLAAVAAWLAAAFIALAAEFIALATARLVLAAVLVLAVSPQAIPKAPSVKRLESAIIFFMSKWTLLSFSKINLLIFTYYRLAAACPRTLNFGTIDNIVIRHTLVNPAKDKKTVYLRIT